MKTKNYEKHFFVLDFLYTIFFGQEILF